MVVFNQMMYEDIVKRLISLPPDQLYLQKDSIHNETVKLGDFYCEEVILITCRHSFFKVPKIAPFMILQRQVPLLFCESTDCEEVDSATREYTLSLLVDLFLPNNYRPENEITEFTPPSPRCGPHPLPHSHFPFDF
eukprot:TRINITY_DN470_c0_g1_i13.p1 TRINITY_DN470_c0_g1~~TRINITY_DN470_c0_g1_i13.p1  ORF type:complete len:136 (+),score=19.33 TRINITY_DN470_c0_g1_i13:299-706(+)